MTRASTCSNERASTCGNTRASTCITTRASTIEHHTSMCSNTRVVPPMLARLLLHVLAGARTWHEVIALWPLVQPTKHQLGVSLKGDLRSEGWMKIYNVRMVKTEMVRRPPKLCWNKKSFLAVQNSSIGDLVTHSVSQSLTQGTFTFDITEWP